MSTCANRDPCTDAILDFIAGGVSDNTNGEAGGNYSAYFGHIKSAVDFSTYTLDGIYAFQDRMMQADPRSTALGRYQFLQRTLKGLQRTERLPSNIPFTPELQDRLAVELLVTRGYSRWWRDEISDEEFAHNLSLEWASLPDPERGGRSHYDGDGVNSASTSLAAVYAMLSRARAAKASAQPAPAPQPSAADSRIAALWRRLFG